MKTKLLFVFAFLASQVSFAKVVVAPIAPTISPLQYCDPNNDGFGEFDFATTTAFILSAQSGTASDYEVTYHSTLNDAENGVASLPSPYFNSWPGNQIVYYRIENVITSEYAVGNLNLNVNPTPVANAPVDLVLCDYNGDGFEIFNLTSLIPEILGGFNPSNYTVTFYHSLVSANADVGAIAPINVYTGTNGEVIYARLTNNATGCYDVVSFQLHVEAIPLAMQPNYPEYALCDLEQNGIGNETFDLGSRINTVLMGQTGMQVTFYPSLVDAQNGVAEISNLLFQNSIQYVQTLGIRITNMATGCYTLSTMDIRVNPLPNLVPPPAPYTICDTNSDGFAVFNLTTLLPDLTQGDANISITFHETLTEAEIGGMSIVAPSFYNNITPFTQTLYVRGEDPDTGCVSIIPINIVANPSPVTPILLDSIMVCDSDSNPQSGSTLFNLTIAIPDILAQQPLPSSNYTVTFYNSLVSASSGISAIISSTNYFGTNGETVWCRVEANTTGCYAVGSFQLIVNTPLSLTTPTPLAVCDDDDSPNNQYTTFDLTVKDAEITQGQPSYVVTYYPSLALAQVGNSSMAIPNPTAYANTISAIQTLGVQVTSPFGCKSVTTLDIRVLPVPILNLVSNNTLNTVYVDATTNNVVRPLLLETRSSDNYSFEWIENGNVVGTNPAFTVTTASPTGADRTFVVTATDLSTGCTASSSIVVLQSTATPPPSGAITQTFNPGATLGDLNVLGSNVLWYASATNRTTLSTPLPLNTPLVNGTTYYASQNIDGLESIARLPVTVYVVLGVPENDMAFLQFAPNPVKDNLTLQSTQVLKSVIVYTMLGQKVLEQNYNTTEAVIDLSRLSSANYILKVEGDVGQKTIRIIKE